MRRIAAIALLVALVAGGCGSTAPTKVPPTASGGKLSADAPSTAATAAPVASSPSGPAALPSEVADAPSAAPAEASPGPDTTTWLCRPGLATNPCEGSLDAALVEASGARKVEPAAPAANPPIDCFYVYPTVSLQTTTNATLAIDPEETAVAAAQAARFSQVCRVFAPIYPQLTLAAIAKPGSINYASALIAYKGVVSAWHSYLAHYNGGRGVVLIGHSQGAFMLTALVRSEIDPSAAERARLVSAVLLGANVLVPQGRSVGGDFASIPACASETQTGCVVAYSTFDTTPPADAVFGRTTSPLSLLAGIGSGPQQVLCVNPAAPAGGTGVLEPYFPSSAAALGFGTGKPLASTPFVSYPDEYSAHCQTADGATWLQIDRIGGSADTRPAPPRSADPAWGLHEVDVNIALGNLVDLVRSQSAAFR